MTSNPSAVCSFALFLAMVGCSSSSDPTATPSEEDAGSLDATTFADVHVPPISDDAGALDGSIDATSHDSDGSTADAAIHDASTDVAPPDGALDAPTDSPASLPDCGAIPTLHPASVDSGPYCPFSAATVPFLTCAFGEHCCEAPAGSGVLSSCAPDCAGLADGGTDWECQDSISCPSGQVCCGSSAGVAANPGCGYDLVHVLRGTVCAASCGVGQVRLCESNIECPGGTICQPAKAKGADFGVCQ